MLQTQSFLSFDSKILAYSVAEGVENRVLGKKFGHKKDEVTGE